MFMMFHRCCLILGGPGRLGLARVVEVYILLVPRQHTERAEKGQGASRPSQICHG